MDRASAISSEGPICLNSAFEHNRCPIANNAQTDRFCCPMQQYAINFAPLSEFHHWAKTGRIMEK
jgi:hypothetical protein